MENNHKMQEVLEKMEKHARQQLLFTKVLCVLCAAAVICAAIIMVAVTGTAKELQALATPVQELTVQAQTVMGNLEEVTQALADADLGSMVENVNVLAADSQAAVTDAMKKLDAVDIDTLNKAIRDLADVVEPLAKVSNIFG